MMTTSTAQLTPALSQRDHVLGPATARITLVEYGDYECPHCGAAHPIVKEIRRQLKKEEKKQKKLDRAKEPAETTPDAPAASDDQRSVP